MASARALLSRGGTDHEKRKMSSKKASWQSGETVMVRATHYKWLQGQVKRLSRGGVAIWVEEAKLLVHVPLQLVASHLSSSSSSPIPPSTSASLLRLPTCQPDRCLLLAVRPAHLSHRPLFQRFSNGSTPDVKAAPPSLAVPEADHYSENHRALMAASQVQAHSSAEQNQIDRNQPASAALHVDDLLLKLVNHHSTPAEAEVIMRAGRTLPLERTGPLSVPTYGMHTDAPPQKVHFPDSPPLSPASSASQPSLKLLESIPESSDCDTLSGKPLTLEKVGKTTSGRFSGPHLEVPHAGYIADNCASSSSSSSSSSTATTPSPGHQTLADRIKKFKLPASETTNPNSQPEKRRSNSQPECLHGSWITIIQDGSHEKIQRFPTT